MACEYGALCTEFFVNQKLSLKMDLPSERETLLSLFERIGKQHRKLAHLRRYEGELLLESDPDLTPYEWMSLRRTSIRSGMEHPESLDVAYGLHRQILEIAPFFLSISPLDVEYLEIGFGFDFEVEANRNDLVFEALFGNSPFANLVDPDSERMHDCQPFLVIDLDERAETQAIIDLKTRVTHNELRSGRFQSAPITLLCRIRREAALRSIDELPQVFDELAGRLESFTDDRVVPRILSPIREVIMSRPS